MMGHKEIHFSDQVPQDHPVYGGAVKTTFFSSAHSPNWNHFSCSTQFMSMDTATVDIAIEDLLKPGTKRPCHVTVSPEYFEKALTITAIITSYLRGCVPIFSIPVHKGQTSGQLVRQS